MVFISWNKKVPYLTPFKKSLEINNKIIKNLRLKIDKGHKEVIQNGRIMTIYIWKGSLPCG